MAIKLEINYAKKIGLRNYSSHQYSVTVRTEVSDLAKVEAASAHLYKQLQEAVDREIQHPGFLPGDEGQPPRKVVPFDRGGAGATPASRNHTNPTSEWLCSEKQEGLVRKLMADNRLSLDDVNAITRSRFDLDLPQLGKMQCSELIDLLIESYRNPNHSLKRGQQ
jgi:hypothetical protein